MFDISKFTLKGKTAIVTGGGRGIGKAIALGFAKQGVTVVITSRKIADLEATAEEIRAFGGQAFPVQAHLSKMDEIHAMVNSAVEKLGGRIDILVNNAGTAPAAASVLDTEERLWDTIINLNAKSLYFTSQAVARIMKKQGSGKIINIGSIDGLRPHANVSIYSISKVAVKMITQAYAFELAGSNIQVNSIAPGPIQTKMLQSTWAVLPSEIQDERRSKWESSLPTGRIGDVDEIVGAAIYLASDAASYTSGSEVIIDGALHLTSPMNDSQGG
ncbi:MAG: SDR family oxidoreductase [Dehalococcoidia bacterium]|nr:SDR family oxidoreductase [Dehalococcoidia bacterium]